MIMKKYGFGLRDVVEEKKKESKAKHKKRCEWKMDDIRHPHHNVTLDFIFVFRGGLFTP